MWRAAAYSALAGVLVPATILMLGWLEDVLDTDFWWLTLGIWVWPSWFFLLATSGREYTRFGLTVLGLSILANVVLYSILGLLAWLVVTRLLR
jgi:hypothetical protein